MGTVTRLKKSLGDIADTHTDVDTGLVDYDAMESDERFVVFEEGVCELQAVRIEEADADTRLAFFINLYNMMIYHAFTKVGYYIFQSIFYIQPMFSVKFSLN